ncbi:MAG: hypothetical protein JWN32_761, partial [Solirubrobacterales bacterium]|nr:hypothetical protein [Solirubrobacterales bacterium]
KNAVATTDVWGATIHTAFADTPQCTQGTADIVVTVIAGGVHADGAFMVLFTQ